MQGLVRCWQKHLYGENEFAIKQDARLRPIWCYLLDTTDALIHHLIIEGRVFDASRVNDVRCCRPNIKTLRIDICPPFEWPVLTQAPCAAEAVNTCRTRILVWLAAGNGNFVARPCRRDRICRRILELNSPPSAQMRMTAGYALMIRPSLGSGIKVRLPSQ